MHKEWLTSRGVTWYIELMCCYIFLSDGRYFQSNNAFLFSLKNSDNQHYKMTVKSPVHAIYCHPTYGPTFGEGRDLYISDNCHVNTSSYSNLGHTYKLPTGYVYNTDQAKRLLAGTYKFKVDEYEVFYQP